MVERRAQAAVIIVFKRNEAEWLQHASARFFRGTQQFGHAMHGTGLRLEGNFDKIALPQRSWQMEQSAGRRNGLKFCFCAAAIF